MTIRIGTLALLLGLAAHPGSAQTAADSAALRATARDYIDGWYSGDGERMERALHPRLAKRLVYVDPQGKSRLVLLCPCVGANSPHVRYLPLQGGSQA
jgi:hypothetical protein